MEIKKANHIKGQIHIPGDKSISHRGVMFGAIADGTTELTGFLDGADCRSTIACFQKMGIAIKQDADHVVIQGKGLHGLTEPRNILDVGNSGTTTRLISGILSGCPFTSTLNGDASIQKRPMQRIIKPLSMMGARITSLRGNDCAPLEIKGGDLHAIHYDSPVASAQVKSAILLAGLYCDGTTSVTEPVLSRNHTELMLSGFGANVTSSGRTASIEGNPHLVGQKIQIPGDISSAAYFIAAASIVPNAELMIYNVNCNPTRDGILKVAEQMGADIKSVNFIHLSYSWQSKDGAYDIYSVYASASYKVASTVIVECRLTYGSSLGAGAENYAFTISSGSTTSSARKCYTFAGDYPGVVSGTGSVRPSEDETYRYSFLE